MAEIATIARPYAEALFKAAGAQAAALSAEVGALAAVAADEQLRQFADNPKTSSDQVLGVVLGVVNGRLAALPEIASQFHALVNAQSGVSDALIESAFPIEPEQLPDVVSTLEQRFSRKLNARVELRPELIGGIRVIVGDEVLDASVKARLDHMKVALTA